MCAPRQRKTGEQSRVDAYLEAQGLWRNELFKQVVQAVLELAKPGTDGVLLLSTPKTTWRLTVALQRSAKVRSWTNSYDHISAPQGLSQ